MSIKIEEAYKKLDLLTSCCRNPELILTDLFCENDNISISNFLYQVRVDGKHISQFITDYLKELQLFNQCLLDENKFKFVIKLQSDELEHIDSIIFIDVPNKYYKTVSDNVEYYKSVMSKEYVFKEEVLDEYYSQFKDLSLLSRIKKAFVSFNTKSKLGVKISNFYFWVAAPLYKKKIDKVIENAEHRVETINMCNKKLYKEDITRQNLYLEKAPQVISNIEKKQKEIAEYLESIGYKEKDELCYY